MKKTLSLLLTVILALSIAVIPTAAAGTLTVSGNSTVASGSNITLTVSLSGSPNAKAASITVSPDSSFTVVSGEWLKSGATLANFDVANKVGALTYTSATSMNGDYFKVTLKAGAVKKGATVSFSITLRDGEVVDTASKTKSIDIVCATHNYGNYEDVSDTQHRHTCSVCGHIETGAHSYGTAEVTKAATCKEAGQKVSTCTVCGHKKTESIPQSSAHTWGGYNVTKAATCTATGTEERRCTTCGKIETKTIPAKGHSYGDWQTTKAATCTEKGTKTRKCKNCTAVQTEAIPALGHAFSNPVTTKAATCTEPGTETGTCTRCGKTTSQAIKPTGHKFGDYTATVPATCTEPGKETHTCTKCGFSETRDVAALGHDFESPTVVRDATISTTGLLEGKCKRCGETTTEIIPCGYTDEATGTVITADEGVFSEGTEIVIENITNDDARYESIKNALADISGSFTAMELKAISNGTVVNPQGNMQLTFKIPAGYGKDIAVYAISDDGTATALPGTINEDGTVTVSASRLSTVAICNLGGSQIVKPESKSLFGDNTILIYILIGALILVIIAAVIVALTRKKKPDEEEELALTEEADEGIDGNE